MADGPRAMMTTGEPGTGQTDRVSDSSRGHMVAAIGEFLGTTMFLFFGLAGAHAANEYPESNTGRLLYVSLAFGLSLAVNAWTFYRISGGLFNPAVTLGLAVVGAIPPIRAAIVVIPQFLGGIVASALVKALLPGPLNVTTALSSKVSPVQGMFLEAVLTFQLVFTIFMLAAEKHKATYVAPLGIGLALFIAELAGVPYTGASLNPARSLGPCVVDLVFPDAHWIYYVGPALGALLAAGVYKTMQILDYSKANAGQDADHDTKDGGISL